MIYDYIDYTTGATIIRNKTYLTISGGVTNKDGYSDIGILYGSLSPIPNEFCISIYENIYNPNRVDWNHIFSFGIHSRNGGDNPYYPFAIGTRNNVSGYGLASYTGVDTAFAIVKNWHLYQIYYRNNTISYYLDNILRHTITGVDISKLCNLYLNGAGCNEVMGSYIKFIKITSNNSLKQSNTIIEDIDKNYYGILKV